MPEVVANTSPLQYLFQLGLLDLLSELYGRVLVPEGVVREIARGLSLGVALPQLSTFPWIEVRRPSRPPVLPMVTDLGAGEREVLALALELSDPLVILDDSLARRSAERLRLKMTGTLGVLLRARQAHRIDWIGPLLDQLEQLHFRLDSTTRAGVLRLAGE
jgi:predicted nucleic acid-binding protein